MANSIGWRSGEGYDIHILRGGPASKTLVSALQLADNSTPVSVTFIPHFLNAPSNFGVTVDTSTGAVLATPAPPNSSRIEINNFLMTVRAVDNTAKQHELLIRIHIHDAVKDLWLTPSTLTIRKDADECRFTVLAAFTDETIGDITDWTQLTYESHDPVTNVTSSDVVILPNGTLKAVQPGKTADIRVSAVLPAAGTLPGGLMTSPPATVFTKPSWLNAAANANVKFVSAGLRLPIELTERPRKEGVVVPNKEDPNSEKRDSVASVLANAPNILFVSEGFDSEREFDALINKVVEDLRTQDHLQPFKILQDSINYWSVFVPSQGRGVTILGEYIVPIVPDAALPGNVRRGHFLYSPKKPDPSATAWSLEEIIYVAGLPVANDPQSFDEIKDLWALRYGARDYEQFARTNFPLWRSLASAASMARVVLNELDSAFGLSNYDRPRASAGFSEVKLGATPRRTSDANIFKFIESLTYGTQNIGATWRKKGKDEGLLCFLCLTQKHSGVNWGGYFLASTGRTNYFDLKLTPTPRNAFSLNIETPKVSPDEELRMSTVVAHEFSHGVKRGARVGIGDEYGDGRATYSDVDHHEGNLLPKRLITTTTGTGTARRTVYDKTGEIKWLWPRVLKAGLVEDKPKSTGLRLQVKLQKGHGRPFAPNDIVRFRIHPVEIAPTQDAIFNFAVPRYLFVTSHSDDEVELALGQPGVSTVNLDSPVPENPNSLSWKDILFGLFKPDMKYALVCPRRVGSVMYPLGVEANLMAQSIRNHVIATHAPLNAPLGDVNATHETAVCGANYSRIVTPSNLPSLSKQPSNLQDIVGLYEGGGGHDCGVFRPTGRCKMRQGKDATVPFCHVCRYLIVDRVDPTKHGELDLLYPEVGP